MSVVSRQESRSFDRGHVAHWAAGRQPQPSANEVWSNLLAFVGLAALIGMIAFLVATS